MKFSINVKFDEGSLLGYIKLIVHFVAWYLFTIASEKLETIIQNTRLPLCKNWL